MGDTSYFDEVPLVASDSKLTALRNAGEKLIDLEKSVEELEAILKTAKGTLHELKTKTVPEMMAELQLLDFTLESGFRIEVNDFVAGSIPKDQEKRKAALEELVIEGGQELIKTSITLQFSKSQHNEALNLAADLKASGYEPEVKEDVHAQSLLAFVRERLRDGEEVKTEVLGVFTGKTTKVVELKSKKTKKSKAAEA